MLLSGENALIYGGAGAIGSTMARAFAREVTRVHVAGRFGSVDSSFNLISVNDVQGPPLVEMSLQDYELPIVTSRSSLRPTWPPA